jgi:hypothetical protein
MSRSSSYFYIVLKLANPTAEVMDSGLNLDDLLDAADFYNSRFKGLKQLLIMKTESVRVHAILTLSELSGISLKRSNLDFSSHVSVFSNFLLNQKKWTMYSRDYRRLMHIYREPMVCSREDVVGALETFGYSDELAAKAAGSLQFVGPSDRAQHKWYLHVQQCLKYPPHTAFESENGSTDTEVPVETATETPVATINRTAATANEPSQVSQPVTVLPRRTTIYSAPAHVIRQQYRQASLEVQQPEPEQEQTFAAALEAVDEPLEALREQSIREAEISKLIDKLAEAVAETDTETETTVDTELSPESVDLDLSEEVVDVSQMDSPPPVSPLNDEQLMAVLHSMVLTQDIGDEQAIIHKKQVIEQIKQLIGPWAHYG